MHLHTSFSSDCSTPPEEVVRAAKARGIRLIAITDHHDVRGWRPAWNVARGVAVLPGVELSCPDGGSAIHIIGIFKRDNKLDEEMFIDTLELEHAGLGSAEDYVPYGVAEAVERIHALGGLAVAAHAHSSKGLLKECTGPALKRIIENCKLDAIEIQGARDPWREVKVPEPLRGVPIISGSDAHHADDRPGSSHPYGVGARPFWAYLGSSPGFPMLKNSLKPHLITGQPQAGVISPMLGWAGKRRVDALLRLPKHYAHVVGDDASPDHLRKIIEAVVDLLNADGGHVLVGARRRFQGAERGAQLRLPLDELIDYVAERVTPTPMVRGYVHRGKHGPMHELAILPGENEAGHYERRNQRQHLERVHSERVALERAGVFNTRPLAERLVAKASRGPLQLAELAGLFPRREWVMDDTVIRDAVAASLAHHVLTTDSPPRWVVQWTRELDRARLELRTAYREQVKRDQGRDHRDRVRNALADRVNDPRERRSVETWLETTQARLQRDQPIFDDSLTDTARARQRARRALGDDFVAQLDAEAEKAAAQYTAAIKGAYGAIAEPVLAGIGGGTAVDLGELEQAGITKIILAGAAGGDAFVAPDPLARVGEAELIEMWAADEPPDAALVPDIVRRVVESGAHLPVMRFVTQLDRTAIDAIIAEFEETKPGARQNRELVIKDLRACLEEPTTADAGPTAVEVLDDLEANETPETLRTAADAALRDPEPIKQELEQRSTLVARIYDLAEPDAPLRRRRPALVLDGCLEDEEILEWWDRETNHQVRIDLVHAASMLEPDEQVDALLKEALESKAGVATAAARALAARGPDGYDILNEHLPVDVRARAYLIKGVAFAAEKAPAHARRLAAKACADASGEAYAAARELDRALHLEEARQAAAGVRPLRAARERRNRRSAA